MEAVHPSNGLGIAKESRHGLRETSEDPEGAGGAGEAARRKPNLDGPERELHPFILAVVLLFSCAPGLRADTALVFNEIMYHPQTNEPAFEWVELYNQMAVDLEVSDWTIQNGISYKFPRGTIIHGGACIVVSISPADLMAATGLTNVLGPFTGRLSNGGETLELHNNSGRLVDSVSYAADGDWPVGPDGSGVSLAKLDPNTASAPAENWAMSEQVGGTPGAKNFPNPALALREGLAFNEVAASSNDVFWIELLNYGTNDIPLENYVLARQGSTNSVYVFPAGQMLHSGDFLAVDETQLGFRGQSGDRLFLYPPAQDRVIDAVVVKARLRGRSPDGTGLWFHPDQATSGASNSFAFHREIVINEIMYDHYPTQSAAGLQPSSEQWVELYNRSSNIVDLTGWRLDGGIQYSFSTGLTIAPDGYLVVAKNAAALQSLYPTIPVVGDFSKSLSRHNDLIVLKDADDNSANQVHYFDGGRWPGYPNRGGSSLELRDPKADNSKAETWAASDETQKSGWSNYTYRTVAALDGGPTQWNEFVIGLLAPGECLVDDVMVVESPTNEAPVQLIANGDFENGAAGWRVLGNHNRSRVESDPDNPANHVLHVIATGPAEHMHNHVEATCIGNRPVVNGRLYEVTFRARWLAGVNLLNTRLYFDRVRQTSVLPVPALDGTPGARNSRYEANIGPTFSQFQHRPVVPAEGEAVTVSVKAEDPQGVDSCVLWWSADGGAWSNSVMNLQMDGLYVGVIPGLPAASIVQFYVQAVDGLGASSAYPAAGPNSRALYKVNDGQAMLGLGHNIRIIMTPADTAMLHALTNVMSNDNLGTTVVCDEQRAYYDMGVRLKSSERGRTEAGRVGFHLEFNRDDLFRGVHPVMLVDRSGRNGEFGQDEILIKTMMNHAGGIPQIYDDLCRVIAPQAAETGPAMFLPRFEDEFLQTQYPQEAVGTLFEYELIYFPVRTDDGTPTGYKLPQPDAVVGVDISDLGDDKEDYRYHFIIKNNREIDDYSRLIDLCKTFSLTGPALDAQAAAVMDVDGWMRTFAMQSLCGVNEIYNSSDEFNYHNVLIYVRSSDHKVVTFPWDMDWGFMEDTQSALFPEYEIYGNQNLSKIIGRPAYTRLYYAQMLDLLDSTVNSAYLSYWVSHYTNFCPGQDFSYALPYIEQRTAFVRGELAGYATASFALRGPSAFSTTNSLLVLTGTAPVFIKTMLVNGASYPVTWTTVTNWSLSLALNLGSNGFTIQGYDLSGNAVTNPPLLVSANFTGPPFDLSGAMVINEIQPDDLSGITDSHNERDPWLELYNAGPDALSLEGLFLANNFTNLLQWSFPAGAVINAGEFKTIFADGQPEQSTAGELHTSFRLVSGTGSIVLSRTQAGAPQILDYIDYSGMHPNLSFGSYPDGDRSQRQEFYYATPGATNSSAFPPSGVFINEWMASNTGFNRDPADNATDDWFELFNTGANPFNLEGYSLTDNLTNKFQYVVPAGYVVPPFGYLLVWADGSPKQNATNRPDLHVNFSLNKSGEAIGLFAANGTQIDAVTFGLQTNNVSQGRYPDGTGSIYFMPTPTPRAPNLVPPVNTPPVLPFINDQTIDELTLLTVTNTAMDADHPANTLSYTLADPPDGAGIDTNGLITWIPSEIQGPGTYTLTTVVTDNGAPNLSATNRFTVSVNEFNLAPLLPELTNCLVLPFTALRFTNTAADLDLPANSLSYTLVSAPAGASIDTNGVITWIPDETPGPTTNLFTTIVTDNNPDAINTHQLSATNSFAVVVYETRSVYTLETVHHGGMIDLLPPGGRYPSNFVVQLTARGSGWTFLGWRGDLEGSDPMASLIMNRDKSVEAIFGTWLATTVSGDGAVLLDPTNRLCAYGATVRLVAVPGASSFFSGWTVTSGNGTATPSANPLTYSVVDPTPAFEAAFEPLDAGQATLTVIPEGRGEVVISPQANRYNLGDTVRLVAVPDAGQRFRRWTGDESSGSLSLDVLVGRSKVITAVFSKRPGLAALPFGNRPAGEDLRLHLTGEPGIDYQIMASDDLRTWTEVAVTSTPYGTAQVSDPLSGGFLHRFYRAVSPPGYTSPPPVSLVSTGSVWRYLDNGSDQGTNWVGHDFDDSTWASGPAQLGYGDDDEATVVSFGGDELNKYVTTYFRHSFDVNDAAIFWGLTVRLLRDDGGVVYLNGVEVFRSNMPAGAIVFSTFATLGVAGSVENTFFESPVDPNLLINGTNVLAVEIHQVSPASSDVSFDLELIGQLE